MELSEEATREFANIWREEFKEAIAPEEARHHAAQLLELYALLARFPADGTNRSSESSMGPPQP